MSAITRVQPMIEIREYLVARNDEFAKALPGHIKPEHFQRVALTALAQNPKLLDVDRRSLYNALMRCAADGLLPDGREAALVIFGGTAQYLRMVGGIRKLVQQSGEITRFEQAVVYEADRFDFRLGDRPHIFHQPALTDRGRPILAYSIAQFRDGTLSREVMSVGEIEKVREVSRARNDGPWVQWWDEMARKTVARRHSKILPMSSETASAVLQPDDIEQLPPDDSAPVPMRQGALSAPGNRPRLAAQLDALGGDPPHEATVEPPRRGRGRPRKDAAAQAPQEVPPKQPPPPPVEDDDNDEPLPDDIDQSVPDSGYDTREERELDRRGGPYNTPLDPDYELGKNDAKAGRMACLDKEIKADRRRFAQWQRGFAAGRAA